MVCNRVLCLICAVRIVRASHRRRVQEPIFHSREDDVAKRAIVEVDRHVARTGTYAPAEPVKRFLVRYAILDLFVRRRATASPPCRGSTWAGEGGGS